MIKKYGDIISGTAVLIFSLALFVMSLNIEVSTISVYGGAVVPQGISIILIGLSIIVIIGGMTKLRIYKSAAPEESRGKGSASHSGIFPVASVLAVTIIYALLLNVIGFIIMTSLCLTILMFILSGFQKKKLLVFAVISIFFSFGINYIFTHLFYLMLPSGLLG